RGSGARDLVTNDARQHGPQKSQRQVLRQEPDQIASVVEGSQWAATAGAAAVIGARFRLIPAAPAPQVRAKRQVDIFEVHEERLGQQPHGGEHSAAVRGSAAHGAEDPTGRVPGGSVGLARAALAGRAVAAQYIAGTVDGVAI